MGEEIPVGLMRRIKTALRIKTNAFDEEITDLILEAINDLNLAGAKNGQYGSATHWSDPLIIRAIKTYCKLNFGEPENPALLKKSYDEQKAQLSMAHEFYPLNPLDFDYKY